jgi:hypothetical protein
MSVIFRSLSLTVIMAFLVADVGERPYPSDFDPYYDQPKIYRQPRYYEYTSKKRKGKRVFKTTKVKNQYGHTVYKKTTSHKVKKKKK